MTRPLVSVVIPAYNAEEYIAECITSIIDQTYMPIEILVIDDCSTDRTSKIVEKMSNEIYDRNEVDIRVIRMVRNMGAAHAINFGFNASHGEYIAWLSADDKYVGKDKIKIQVDKMIEDQSDWSYFDSFWFGGVMDTAKVVTPTYLPKLNIFDILFEKYNILRFFCLFWRNPIQGSSFMITREAYEKYGGFNSDMGNADADRDFWFRLSLYGARLSVIHGYAPVFYRIHPKQLSNDTKTMEAGMSTANRTAWELFVKYLTGRK